MPLPVASAVYIEFLVISAALLSQIACVQRVAVESRNQTSGGWDCPAKDRGTSKETYRASGNRHHRRPEAKLRPACLCPTPFRCFSAPQTPNNSASAHQHTHHQNNQ